MRYAGSDYNPILDDTRLDNQMFKVFNLMKDGQWRTLREISTTINEPESSISAQLRHLKKPRFGGYVVIHRPKKDRSQGLYEYRLFPPRITEKQLTIF